MDYAFDWTSVIEIERSEWRESGPAKGPRNCLCFSSGPRSLHGEPGQHDAFGPERRVLKWGVQLLADGPHADLFFAVFEQYA